jgi:ABC-type transport system involved in cytochrome c biogenesis permease subunit
MIGVSLVMMGFFLACLAGLGYIAFLLWKYRDREIRSLEYVLLQVAVPRDNEIKIDAAEQMFGSLYSIHE